MFHHLNFSDIWKRSGPRAQHRVDSGARVVLDGGWVFSCPASLAAVGLKFGAAVAGFSRDGKAKSKERQGKDGGTRRDFLELTLSHMSRSVVWVWVPEAERLLTSHDKLPSCRVYVETTGRSSHRAPIWLQRRLHGFTAIQLRHFYLIWNPFLYLHLFLWMSPCWVDLWLTYRLRVKEALVKKKQVSLELKSNRHHTCV